jgi:ribonuclease HI
MTGSIRKRKEISQFNLFEKECISPESKHQKKYSMMYCDGASSGNPGKSGIGIVINLSDNDAQTLGKDNIYRISEYIGSATNNVAEYSALIKGLRKARSLGLKKIKIYLDSELLVRQINGIYKVKNKNLIPLWVKTKDILKDFDDCIITHIPREMNREADSLARQAVKKEK